MGDAGTVDEEIVKVLNRGVERCKGEAAGRPHSDRIDGMARVVGQNPTAPIPALADAHREMVGEVALSRQGSLDEGLASARSSSRRHEMDPPWSGGPPARCDGSTWRSK